MQNEFIRLNIALKPPKPVAEKVIALSGELGKRFEARFVLDGIGYLPHITVYSPEYPASNLERVLDIVRDIAAGTNKIKLRSDGFEAKQGFVGVKFDLTDEIRKFHEKVVARLNPIREDHVRAKYGAEDYKMKMSPEKLANIEKYGYPNAMALYSPHLTVIRLADEKQAEDVCRELQWDIPKFEAGELGIYKMGDHGTCKELVKAFELV